MTNKVIIDANFEKGNNYEQEHNAEAEASYYKYSYFLGMTTC